MSSKANPELFDAVKFNPQELGGDSWWAKGAPSAPIAWYGGKKYYAKWIIEHFCDHRVFVEPFGGAANILLRKRKSEVEIYNDLDSRITNFFNVVRDRDKCLELVRIASLTPYSRELFAELADRPEPEEEIEKAWWFFVRCRQAIGGLGMSELTPKSWSASTRTRRDMPEGVSKYLSSIDGLETVSQRLREVMFESMPAIDVIKKYDSDETLIYLDPPYLPETRHGGKASTYGVEMSYEDHLELLDLVKACKSKIVLSGYLSDLYAAELKDWKVDTVEGKSHMSNSGQSRVEVLWLNF